MNHCRLLAPLTLLATLLLTAGMTAGCETNTMLREQGREALYQGDYERAAERFERALERRATDSESLYYLGLIRLYQGQPRQAQLALERAANLRAPHSRWTPSILDALAESFYQQERYDRLQAFVRETAIERGHYHDYLREAEYLVRIGDLDGARTAFRKAGLFTDEPAAEPFLAMSDFYASIQDHRQAQQALRWAAHVEPNHPGLNQRLAGLGMSAGTLRPEQPPSLEDMITQREDEADAF